MEAPVPALQRSALRIWIATLAVGRIPGSPGTYGSAITGLLLYGLWTLVKTQSHVSAIWNGILLLGLFGFGALCVWIGKSAVVDFGKKDPGQFVLDEAAGMCLTMLLLPVLPVVPAAQEHWVMLAAFAAFRVFDIFKPPPCKLLERLPAGWGILMDDLAAAIYANIVCQIIFRIVIY